MSKKLYEALSEKHANDRRTDKFYARQDPYWGYGKADFENFKTNERPLLQPKRD